MGQQESKYREATIITEEVRIELLQKLADTESHVKELTKVVQVAKYEAMNSVDFLLVMSEIFESLGGILGITHPDSYIELLTNQFEIAKNGLKSIQKKETLQRTTSSDSSTVDYSPAFRRKSTRPKVNLLDLKSLTLPLRYSKTERGWFDFSKDQTICVEDIIRSCFSNPERKKFPQIR